MDEIKPYHLQYYHEKVLVELNFKKTKHTKWNYLASCGQAESNADIDKRTRKITHRIAELFSLIKENQSDR